MCYEYAQAWSYYLCPLTLCDVRFEFIFSGKTLTLGANKTKNR